MADQQSRSLKIFWGFYFLSPILFQVLLEIVGVKNLPVGHKGSLYVSFSKTQPDTIFNGKRRLTIFSESGEKQVASFQCEPTGELLFQLISHSPSNLPNLPIPRPSKKMGSTSLSLREFLSPISRLSVEKWLELVPSSGNVGAKPICLRIAISFTVPAIAPRIFHTVCSRPFLRSSCFFPLPGRIQHAKRWTRVIDEAGSEVISLQMRYYYIDFYARNWTITLPAISLQWSVEIYDCQACLCNTHSHKY